MAAVFEYLEIIGVSSVSMEAAIKTAVEQAASTKKIAWFEVQSVRGRVLDASGEIEYQVTVKFGCKV